MGGRKRFREEYENGGGRTWGIWNSIKKEFQFGIKEKSPMLAEEKLFEKIGWNAAKYRFKAEAYPQRNRESSWSAVWTAIRRRWASNPRRKIEKTRERGKV